MSLADLLSSKPLASDEDDDGDAPMQSQSRSQSEAEAESEGEGINLMDNDNTGEEDSSDEGEDDSEEERRVRKGMCCHCTLVQKSLYSTTQPHELEAYPSNGAMTWSRAARTESNQTLQR